MCRVSMLLNLIVAIFNVKIDDYLIEDSLTNC